MAAAAPSGGGVLFQVAATPPVIVGPPSGVYSVPPVAVKLSGAVHAPTSNAESTHHLFLHCMDLYSILAIVPEQPRDTVALR